MNMSTDLLYKTVKSYQNEDQKFLSPGSVERVMLWLTVLPGMHIYFQVVTFERCYLSNTVNYFKLYF